MRKKALEQEIKILDLSSDIENILIINNILFVKDLWVLNRKNLKEINLTDKQINEITIKLQLLGLDLNKKVY
ncbi:MAG TPA: hypothetical protein GXZ95_00515 [Mollicutes bacterium]|nr:hypothetical protein [Mollicutes bacterium]